MKNSDMKSWQYWKECKEKEKKDKDYLNCASTNNIMKHGYVGGKSLAGIWFNVRQFFRNIKGAVERIKYGFAAQDVWGLNEYLGMVICDSVGYLAEHHMGYPAHGELQSDEAWTEYLREISNRFLDLEKYDEIEMNEIDWDAEISEEEQEARGEQLKALWKEKEEKTREAFEMIGKVWSDLWD